MNSMSAFSNQTLNELKTDQIADLQERIKQLEAENQLLKKNT